MDFDCCFHNSALSLLQEKSFLLCGSITVLVGYLENFFILLRDSQKLFLYWDFSLPHFLWILDALVKFHIKYKYILNDGSGQSIQFIIYAFMEWHQLLNHSSGMVLISMVARIAIIIRDKYTLLNLLCLYVVSKVTFYLSMASKITFYSPIVLKVILSTCGLGGFTLCIKKWYQNALTQNKAIKNSKQKQSCKKSL